MGKDMSTQRVVVGAVTGNVYKPGDNIDARDIEIIIDSDGECIGRMRSLKCEIIEHLETTLPDSLGG